MINHAASTSIIPGLTLVYGAQTTEITFGWSFCVSVTTPDLVHVFSVAVDVECMVGHDSALCVQNGKENWRYYKNEDRKTNKMQQLDVYY